MQEVFRQGIDKRSTRINVNNKDFSYSLTAHLGESERASGSDVFRASRWAHSTSRYSVARTFRNTVFCPENAFATSFPASKIQRSRMWIHSLPFCCAVAAVHYHLHLGPVHGLLPLRMWKLQRPGSCDPRMF